MVTSDRSLSTNDLNIFRPISNLDFFSNIFEKVASKTSLTSSHLVPTSLSSSFQSACCTFHLNHFSPVLCFHNDLIITVVRGEVTSLILLDLSLPLILLIIRTITILFPSPSKLVRSSLHFFWLVSILPYLSLSSCLHPKFHIINLSFPGWTFRFCTWPTSFHSLYKLTRLCHLQELNHVSPLCWLHPVIHHFSVSWWRRGCVWLRIGRSWFPVHPKTIFNHVHVTS